MKIEAKKLASYNSKLMLFIHSADRHTTDDIFLFLWKCTNI